MKVGTETYHYREGFAGLIHHFQLTPYPTNVLQHIADTYVVTYYLDHSKLAGTHIHEDRIQDFFLLLLAINVFPIMKHG